MVLYHLFYQQYIFEFRYSNSITYFKSTIFFIMFINIQSFIISNIYWFHFNSPMFSITIFINYIIQNIVIHILPLAVICLYNLFFNVLMNLSATTDLPSLKVEYIIIPLSDNHFLKTRL